MKRLNDAIQLLFFLTLLFLIGIVLTTNMRIEKLNGKVQSVLKAQEGLNKKFYIE